MRESGKTDRDAQPGQDETSPLAEMFERMYDDLRRIACRRRFAGRRPDEAQASALVHETYIRFRRRLRTLSASGVADREAFVRIVTLMMKTVAIDRYRMSKAGRRGGGRLQSLAAADPPDRGPAHEVGPDDVLVLDEALARLRAEHPDWFAVLTHRYFAGRSYGETARLLGVERAEVHARRRSALRWLRRALQSGE